MIKILNVFFLSGLLSALLLIRRRTAVDKYKLTYRKIPPDAAETGDQASRDALSRIFSPAVQVGQSHHLPPAALTA